MSFKQRFDSSEPMAPIDCIYGPPWCGKCQPVHCLFLMEYSYMLDNAIKVENLHV